MRGISASQMRKEIIKPALMDCVYNGKMLWSANAEEILIATMAHESKGGYYLAQEGGPALGVYQDEKLDYDDMMTNFLLPKWKKEIFIPDFVFNDFDRIKHDLIYATQIARLHYLRAPEPLPAYDDLDAQWDYYRKYYNSVEGKATKDEFIADYKAYTTV